MSDSTKWQDKDSTRTMIRKFNSLRDEFDRLRTVLNNVERIPVTVKFDIGNGEDSKFTLSHNLGNRLVLVQVSEKTIPYEVVNATIELTSENIVTIKTQVPPTPNQYEVLIIG